MVISHYVKDDVNLYYLMSFISFTDLEQWDRVSIVCRDSYHVKVAIATHLPEALDAREHVARASVAPTTCARARRRARPSCAPGTRTKKNINKWNY